MANAGAIKAGAAFVQLFADDSALQSGLKAAEKSVKSFGLSVGRIGTQLAGLGAAITGSILGAAKEFADTGSALNDMSDRTGISVERLSELSFAAKQSGTDLETVESAVRRMQKALVAGTDESAAAAGAFNMLGLSVQKLMGMNAADQLATVARRIAAVRDPTARAAAAMAIWGKSGTALLPMSKDLDALTEKARKLGQVWTTEEAKRADALGDAIDVLTGSFKRVIAVIGSAVAPLLTELAGEMAQGAKSIMDFVKANEGLVVVALKVGASLIAAGAALLGLKLAIIGVSSVLGSLSAIVALIHGALLLLLTPLGLVVVGFVGMTTAMGKWREAAKLVKGMFSGLLETVQETVKGMSDALKAGDLALAAEIMFAGLKVEFLKGTMSLTKIWSDWGVAIAEVFRGITFNVKAHLIDIKAAIAGVKAEPIAAIGMKQPMGMLHALGDALRGFGLGIANRFDAAISQGRLELIEMIRAGEFEWKQFSNLITGTFLDAEKHGKSLMEINKAAEAASTAIRQGFAERKAAREKAGGGAGAADDAREAAQQKEILDEIEKKRQAAQAALLGAEDAEVVNRRKAAADAVAAAEKELADAKAKLKGKVHEAAILPAEASGEGGQGNEPGKKKEGEDMTPDGLAAGLKSAAARIDVAGSFSAAAAAGMGAGSSIEKIQKDHLDESKAQSKTLEKIQKNTAKQQVFAD